jgi:hypothetical protein
MVGSMILTALRAGEYKIKAFVKAENIEVKHYQLTFNVSEGAATEIKK